MTPVRSKPSLPRRHDDPQVSIKLGEEDRFCHEFVWDFDTCQDQRNCLYMVDYNG